MVDYLSSGFVHPGRMDLGRAGWSAIQTSAAAAQIQTDVAPLVPVVARQPVGKRREQSGAPRPGVQAKRPRAAGEELLFGPGLPGGRVVKRGRQQLPERAEVHTQDALRLPRCAGEHESRAGDLLIQDPRGDEGGPHLSAKVPSEQVLPVQPGDPVHQLQRGRHLHQRSFPEGSGESDS